MARCAICDARPYAGKNVSHSNRHTNRWFKPNIQRAKLILNGRPQRIKVCTRCLRTHQNVRFRG
jgi:large subunit ribosomal protein L28